jgi:ribosomal protein L16 Arg81 hydroxylase
MELRVEKNAFPAAKNITWDDVIDKIRFEFEQQTHKLFNWPGLAPTIVLHQCYFKNTILDAYEQVRESENTTEMHTYLSFGKSQSFGNHRDTMDVLIVQAIGRVGYIIDDTETHWLDPGDAMWIPSGIYHDPVVLEPRVTLSFSWD